MINKTKIAYGIGQRKVNCFSCKQNSGTLEIRNFFKNSYLFWFFIILFGSENSNNEQNYSSREKEEMSF